MYTKEGKGKNPAEFSTSSVSESVLKEIEELEALVVDTEAKLRDLTEALEKEVEGGTIGQESESLPGESVVINDISNLVKKSSKVSSSAPEASDLKRKETVDAATSKDEAKKLKMEM